MANGGVLMRITHFRTTNILSFDNLDMDLTGSPFTVFVGPNGSGKTNVFRIIRLLIEGMILYSSPGGPINDWISTFNAWKRNSSAPSSIEIDILWTDKNEGKLIAKFIRMLLATPEEIAKELPDLPNTIDSQPEWVLFVDSLRSATSAQTIKTEWSGTLGCRYSSFGELIFYFRPVISKNEWVCLLGPSYSGIVNDIPELPFSGYKNPSLASTWIKSLPMDTKAALHLMLKGEASPDSITLSVSWPDIWAAFQSEAQKMPGIWVLNIEIKATAQGNYNRHWREILQELGILSYSQNNLSFLRLLAHLLNHLVISEDLLSPPAIKYFASTWWQRAKVLTSRHLGAYLLSLKNGQDSERTRFAMIQDTFKVLSGRQLDVTFMKEKSEEQSNDIPGDIAVRISLNQQDPNDLHSVPLAISGSGLVEIAYLSAILNSPGSHVILLDEPGRSLHPQALIQLRCMLMRQIEEPSAPQIIFITHSPYLIPPSAPHTIRRVRRITTTGCTEITCLSMPTPISQKTKQEVERRNLERQDRWGRSPNWPSLLFSTIVLLVDGETELGALPEWYQRIYHEPVESLGVSILSIGGKNNLWATVQDLDNLGIPWMALIDGDSLHKGSGNIWTELKKTGRINNETANRFRRMQTSVQVQKLQEFDIYVMGQTQKDNFETVLKSENPDIKMPTNFNNSKVISGRWWAQNVNCPQIVQEVFNQIREVRTLNQYYHK